MSTVQKQLDFQTAEDPAALVPAYAMQAVEYQRGASIRQKFQQFHDHNPHVYFAIVSIARELKRRGHRRFGIKQIVERIRWQYDICTKASHYKINNNFTSEYARLVMQQEPDLDGFFATRELKAKR